MKRYFLLFVTLLLTSLSIKAFDPIRISIVSTPSTTANLVVAVLSSNGTTKATIIPSTSITTDGIGSQSLLLNNAAWALYTYAPNDLLRISFGGVVLSIERMEVVIAKQALYGATISPDAIDQTENFTFKQIGILESGTNPTDQTILKGGDQTSNITYTLPKSTPSTGQVLSVASSPAPTEISGATLEWVTPTSGCYNVPFAPTMGTVAISINGSVNITYTGPISNGGTPITSYTATSTPGGITGTLNTVGNGTITVSGLTIGTAYTFTIKATNEVGTGPESATSCSVIPFATVTIGSQVWMKKNLNVSTYRNGDVIPQVTSATDWANLTTGAWCYYDNNANNGTIYGKLYNWYAANDSRGLAPLGWHVASDAEWTTLETSVGGASVAGDKLRETGITHWRTPNTGATDQYGFSALPGGTIDSDGSFWGNVNYGFWMCMTYDATPRLSRMLGYDRSFSSTNSLDKLSGNSVRCVKD